MRNWDCPASALSREYHRAWLCLGLMGGEQRGMCGDAPVYMRRATASLLVHTWPWRSSSRRMSSLWRSPAASTRLLSHMAAQLAMLGYRMDCGGRGEQSQCMRRRQASWNVRQQAALHGAHGLQPCRMPQQASR
jgi:hypothetical protein